MSTLHSGPQVLVGATWCRPFSWPQGSPSGRPCSWPQELRFRLLSAILLAAVRNRPYIPSRKNDSILRQCRPMLSRQIYTSTPTSRVAGTLLALSASDGVLRRPVPGSQGWWSVVGFVLLFAGGADGLERVGFVVGVDWDDGDGGGFEREEVATVVAGTDFDADPAANCGPLGLVRRARPGSCVRASARCSSTARSFRVGQRSPR
jgi:hypothetical protein